MIWLLGRLDGWISICPMLDPFSHLSVMYNGLFLEEFRWSGRSTKRQ